MEQSTAPSNEPLRAAIEEIADQLCMAVDGHFDFRVDVDVSDPSAEKLHMLINFVLDAARRSIEEHRIVNEELQKAMSQVESARIQAEIANRAKSEFLANMSHELRTPLTAILGFANLLRDESTDQQRATVDIISRNGEHLLNVINDILDLTKVETGRFRMTRSEVAPLQIINDVIADYRRQALEKHLQLGSRLVTTTPPTISTDPVRFRQILTNLISNAIKFTEQGSIDLEISYLPPPADLFSIDIVDTGIGINDDHVERLFRPFSQVDTSMSRSFGGTGLGLIIARRFAEMLGGDVTIVSSEPGRGSRFRCRIAANTDAIARPTTSETPAQSRGATSANASESDADAIRGLHILFVEDGPDNRRLVSHILKKRGAGVTIAENGQIAVDMFERSLPGADTFDAILMDMQMPVMDGYTATARLREMNVRTPIIALTAHAMTGDREKCIAAGCDDYATKPISPKELVRIIASHVRKSAVSG